MMKIEGELKAIVSVPEGEAPPSGWPLLCFLHGYDEGAPVPIDEGLVRHGPLRPDHPAEIRRRFVILAPQLPVRGDLWLRHHRSVLALVDDVGEEHAIDRSRRYLTGFSFGGNGVLDMAAARPDPWAALWPVDPTRVPDSDPGIPVWLSAGNLARRIRGPLVEGLALRSGPDSSASRVWLDDGEDHVGSARRAYGDLRIYEWLLRWRSVEARTETRPE